MKRMLIPFVVVLGVSAVLPAAAQTPRAHVEKVLAGYRAALPRPADLTREKGPILLVVVTNSYGNLYTGHC